MQRTLFHHLAALAAATALVSLGSTAAHAANTAAAAFPSKTVRIVVPFPPGGGSDILGRTLSAKLTAAWKHPVVVENLPGAGGAIGADAVAKAAPDGHTLLIADTSILTINPTLYPSLPYKATDLKPVINLSSFGFIVVVPATSPITSMKSLLAMDKTRTSKLNVASSGTGTSNHLALEKFNSVTGLKLGHVPYKGAGQAILDVVGGQVDLMFTSGPLAAPLMKEGKLRAIAVTSERRMGLTPDVPTLIESGVTGAQAIGAQGVFAPAGTPAAIVDRINADIATALALPDVRDRWAQMGLEAEPNTAAQFGDWIRRETDGATELIRNAAIKAQ